MSNLAALFDWLAAKPASRAREQRGDGSDFRMRTLPKEEIHLFVKEIDNSKVVRLVDQRDWWQSLCMAGGVIFTSLLLIALLLPGGYDILASRRMHQLEAERQRLVNELRQVRVLEQEWMAPAQLQQWAGDRFVDPPPGGIVFAPPSSGTVASLSQK